MAKRSKTTLNIDKINRQLDRISNTFGSDTYEISNYIQQNGLQSLDFYRTKSGKVHVRNSAENRKHYQKISAVSKKPISQYIAKAKARYKPPKVKKSPIPPQLPEKPTVKDIKKMAEKLASFSDILEYIYENHPELDSDNQDKLAKATWRKHPTISNVPKVVEETYTELYTEFFDDGITDDFEAVDGFANPDFFT